MVWLIAGLPATVVIAAFVTYYIAASHPDPLVKADYQKEGLAWVEKVNAADQLASRLGLRARLTSTEGLLLVSLAGREPLDAPAHLVLTVVHPTRDSQDVRLSLERSTENTYLARLPDLGEGRRDLVLESADGTWRMTGQWQAPFAGIVEMAAKSSHSSTHP